MARNKDACTYLKGWHDSRLVSSPFDLGARYAQLFHIHYPISGMGLPAGKACWLFPPGLQGLS
jgi:hypothetical protein